MVMNCPILGHPLVDGVIVENEAVVRFIQKVVVDFRPQEQICRQCYREALAAYEDKSKRAKELKLSRLHANSISTLKSSTASSSASVHHSLSSNDSYHSFVYNLTKSTHFISTPSIFNNSSVAVQTAKALVRLSQEPTTSAKALAAMSAMGTSVVSTTSTSSSTSTSTTSTSSTGNATTVRKRTINDFFTPKVTQHKANGKDLQNISQNGHLQDSQLANKSPAAASQNGSISQVTDLASDDDSPRMSLNYFNGTRLPNVQPFPPRRKPALNHPGPSVMDEYIKDITGG